MEIKQIKNIIENYDTPTYVFDIRTLKDRIQYLRRSLPKHIELCYAIKANTFIIKDIENDVDRFEVCSNGEYEICQSKKIKNEKILISGINKDKKAVETMIEKGNVRLFSIESMTQYDILKNQKQKVKAIIRITNGNQFGINESDCKKIIEDREMYPNLEIVGLQFFTGTQKTSIKKLTKEIEYMDNFIAELEQTYNFKIQEFEFGTGLPVYYFKNDEFNEDEFMQEFSDVLNNLKFKGRIILEIGRSIVASCGIYITKIVDKKINKNERYAIVDGGMNHIVYYGQFMAMKIPDMEIYPRRIENVNETWNICGSLCTTNDILVKQLKVSDLQIGDALIFKNTGAYCMTEGMSLFLSRDLPQILKNDINNNIEVIRKTTPIYTLNM
jgi:diaminopimelate decarboxylase